jgi:hypothetical protein
MPLTQAPEPSKTQEPQSTFAKILAATPVVMTVIATLLAGLASSEMTSAQYDRSLAAQQQSKAGDQWSYFQTKKLRGALDQNAFDVLQMTSRVAPLDVAALKGAVAQDAPGAPKNSGSRTNLGAMLESDTGKKALEALGGEDLKIPAGPALDPKLQAVIDAIVNDRPDAETVPLVAKLIRADVDLALRASQERAKSFSEATKPITQSLDALQRLLSSGPSTAAAQSVHQSFAAARLRYEAQRYDAEARLNQAIGNLYEVEVHLSNFSAERHRMRSQEFFVGMLIAQAAVIISTLAMAARQRNALWTLAAAAGLAAIAFAFYVYLCV